MTDVFLERTFDPPISAERILSEAGLAGSCFNLHQVQWMASFLSPDGRELVCWFRAPDAESARIALRKVGADITRLWHGTVHDADDPVHPGDPDDADGADDPVNREPNALVTRQFDEPVELAEVQAIENIGAWCLAAYRVQFVRTLFAADRRRMLCLYRAPDAESVRLAQRQARMPVETVRAITIVRPHTATH